MAVSPGNWILFIGSRSRTGYSPQVSLVETAWTPAPAWTGTRNSRTVHLTLTIPLCAIVNARMLSTICAVLDASRTARFASPLVRIGQNQLMPSAFRRTRKVSSPLYRYQRILSTNIRPSVKVIGPSQDPLSAVKTNLQRRIRPSIAAFETRPTRPRKLKRLLLQPSRDEENLRASLLLSDNKLPLQ